MQGNTHRVGGMACALTGYVVLERKGMLIRDVSPLLQLAIMYPFAIYGSIFPDLDHNQDCIPSRDIVSLSINKILHLTSGIRRKSGDKLSNPVLAVFDAQHRSWQTHSDLFLLFCVALYTGFMSEGVSTANDVILKLIFTGFMLGAISHMVLDMLTPAGIWCVGLSALSGATKSESIPRKIRLVPKSKFFATGGAWETLVRYLLWAVCIYVFCTIVYGMLPVSMLSR